MFFVSFSASQDVEICHQIGQSVMLDNGAYSFWTKGIKPDWNNYYKWCERWLQYPTTWAVIPDIIDGTERENLRLIADWPFKTRGSPVWHLHESIKKLLNMVQYWPIVCFGSSKQYSKVRSDLWRNRVDNAFNELANRGPIPWIHMLRGMQLAGSEYPFASLDSTDVARNHNRPQNTAKKLVEKWDSMQCPSVWKQREQLNIFKPKEQGE